MGHTHLLVLCQVLEKVQIQLLFWGIVFGQMCLTCLSFDMACIHYLAYSCCRMVRHMQDKGIWCQRANYQWNPFATLLYLRRRVFGSKLLVSPIVF